MKKSSLLTVMLTLAAIVILQPIAKVSAKVSETEIAITEQVCQLEIDFEKKPRTKKQALNLSADVQMAITNKISINKALKARIATNVSCQKLMGASYTGSEAEWAKFFDSAISGLVQSGSKGLEFTLVGDNDREFNAIATSYTDLASSFIAKEYTFSGEIRGTKQVIRNLALLDKESNILYTLSVSGHDSVTTEIGQEFSRLVTSIKAAK
jgi:hypothetical protein